MLYVTLVTTDFAPAGHGDAENDVEHVGKSDFASICW